jgi:D-glutamate cyclase
MVDLAGRVARIQAIIGTDAGNRGMKALIVPGDLLQAAKIFVHHSSSCGVANSNSNTSSSDATARRQRRPVLVVLSGFPCCVEHTPPTETDGPSGAIAIGRAGLALGYSRVVIVTDECNRQVFEAACTDAGTDKIVVESFPAATTTTFGETFTDCQAEARFTALKESCSLLVACERAGPSQDGRCYTMRGIDMTGRGLIAPLHRLVDECPDVPFLAIGDGGNELGMGKVYDIVKECIVNGAKIGCVMRADHLIAASVSNWGGYALAAAAALIKAIGDGTSVDEWTRRCLPTEQQEIALLQRVVAAGGRDGVTGKMEATVDGMSLERSLQCLQDIRRACIADEDAGTASSA